MIKVLSVNGKIPLVDGKAIKALDNIAMRVDSGYIQYSTDNGKTWVNLIAKADLKGDKGDPGIPGKDGHSPVVTATKSGKTTTISVDGTAIATVEDGADGAPGKNGTDGHTPVKGTDYWTASDKAEIVAEVTAALPKYGGETA